MNAMTDLGLYRHLDQMAPWNDRLQVLEVIGVSDEAPDVKTFTFRSDNQTWFRYKPGQFVTLELPTADIFYNDKLLDRNAALARLQASKRLKASAFSQVSLKALPDNKAEQEQLFRRVRGWLSPLPATD